MFERITARGKQVIRGAEREAGALGHGYVGTEHLLLALLADDGPGCAELARAGVRYDDVRNQVRRHTGVVDPFDAEATAALESIGIDLDAVRTRLIESFGPAALAPREAPRRGLRVLMRRHRRRRPFTSRAKQALVHALVEARQLGHDHVAAEHLLLGLLREGGGLAVRILAQSGVDSATLRRDVLDGLSRAA